MGCGFDPETKGKAKNEYEHGAPETRTCPQYFAQQPEVVEVMRLVEPYRRGALGNVLDLPAPLTDYLDAADAELRKHHDEMEWRAHA